jgi:hypothetical protein
VTAVAFFANGSGLDWQAVRYRIARNDAACGVTVRARLYMEVQF